MLWSIFAFITSLLCKGWNGEDKTHHLHQEFFHKFGSPVCFTSLVRHNKRNPSSHCFLLRFQGLINGSLYIHQISPCTPSHPAHPHTLHTLTPSTPSHPPHPAHPHTLHTLHTLTPSTPCTPSHPPHPAHPHTLHTLHTLTPSHPAHPHTLHTLHTLTPYRSPPLTRARLD